MFLVSIAQEDCDVRELKCQLIDVDLFVSFLVVQSLQAHMLTEFVSKK